MNTFKTPIISSILRIIGALALAWVPIVLFIVLTNDLGQSHLGNLIYALPGLVIGLVSFIAAKIIDLLALIAHNTTPK